MKPTIKWVFCSYINYLIVRDVYGNRVDELCGEITYEKCAEIERRSKEEVTLYEGLDRYKCALCELKKEIKENDNGNKDRNGT